MKEYLLDVLQKTQFLNVTFRVYEWLKLANLRYLMPNITIWRKGSPDGLPLPSLKLIVLVSGVPSIAAFLIGGDKAAQNIRNLRLRAFVVKSQRGLSSWLCVMRRFRERIYARPFTLFNTFTKS